MKLQSGIKIADFGERTNRVKSRILLSSGTVKYKSLTSIKEVYNPEAFLPLYPWRLLSNAEKKILYCDDRNSFDRSSSIAIVTFPETLIEPFNRINSQIEVKKTVSTIHTLGKINKGDYHKEISDLKEYILSVYSDSKDIETMGIAINMPKLTTVTFNPIERYFIGLHVDSWDQSSFFNRNKSRNRICINLGMEVRELLFINLTLSQIHKILSKIEAPKKHTTPIPNQLIGKFMEGFPEYPVIKIRIAPGEAYVAPTENIIHDGSTIDMQNRDIHLTFLGHFSPSFE